VKYLRLVWSGLMRKKLRTILTVLSILVAFVLFAYLSAIHTGFSIGVELAGQDRLIVRHKVSLIQLLPEAHQQDIQRVEGVEAAVHMTWFGGTYQRASNFFAQMPVEPGPFLDMFPEYVLDDSEREAWLATRTGAIVGRNLADRFGWKIGDRIPIDSALWAQENGNRVWEFDIVGIYEGAETGTDTSQMFFRYDYFDEARGFGDGMVGWYTARIENPDQAAEIARTIDAQFANSPHETKSEPEGAFIQGFANQMGNIGLILTLIVGAVFFTILLVTANTMAYTVRERTNELAVLKAIGFTDRGVLGLVLGESFMLALIGGGIGLALGWFMVSLGDPSGGALPSFYIPPRNYLFAAVLIAALALAAGSLPALEAKRLQIADALRR
jgi:putative ABC transport system permease protein